MALVTSIFGGETLERGTSTEKGTASSPTGFLLSDQEYYDLYVRPKEEEIRRGGELSSAAMGRAARAKQGQFLQAQGLGGSAMGAQAQSGMTEAFSRAVRRARQSSKMEAEDLRRREFAERDRLRAQELGKVQQVSNVEAALASLIPYAGPFISAGTQAAGALWGLGLSDTPQQRTTSEDLEVVDFGTSGGDYGEPAASGRTRGGGGYDLYA